MSNVIGTSGLRKAFRTGRGRKATVVEAVRGADRAVGEGEIFGFLGPTGAGKTTLDDAFLTKTGRSLREP